MAKKAVASFKDKEKSERRHVKCIKMVKSDKTNAYTFKTEMVFPDDVKEFFEAKK